MITRTRTSVNIQRKSWRGKLPSRSNDFRSFAYNPQVGYHLDTCCSWNQACVSAGTAEGLLGLIFREG